MNLTKRKKEDLQLVYNAIKTLLTRTDYGITRLNCEMMEEDDIHDIVSDIFSVWIMDEIDEAIKR